MEVVDHDDVELTEPRLVSVDSEVASVADDAAERRRDEAVAISNCCLVCWCMSLRAHIRIQLVVISGPVQLTFDMRSVHHRGWRGRIAVRSGPLPVLGRRSRWSGMWWQTLWC